MHEYVCIFQFIASKSYSVYYWPAEVNNESSSLMSRCSSTTPQLAHECFDTLQWYTHINQLMIKTHWMSIGTSSLACFPYFLPPRCAAIVSPCNCHGRQEVKQTVVDKAFRGVACIQQQLPSLTPGSTALVYKVNMIKGHARWIIVQLKQLLVREK